MNTDDMTMHDALTFLHEGTDRQGPGDDAFSLEILRRLPDMPPTCSIADLGCGTGIASFLLADHFRQPVLCVDTSEAFLSALTEEAARREMTHLITPLCMDMGALDPERYQFDLLWSEGAAYNLTFDGAMRRWRPLMAEEGIAVVSEMSWFGPDRPQEVLDYWGEAYPEMASEAVNIATAKRHGFDLLFTERLPAQAWWATYYDPLLKQLEVHAASASKTMQEAISDTRREIDLFRQYAAYYGYSFYVLKAV